MTEKEHNSFEFELPEGYEEAYYIDAKNKRTAVILSVASFLISIPLFIVCILPILPVLLESEMVLWHTLLICISFLLYIVLHELTHGAAYKILTGQKLTYGFTLAVAYCGVPDIYVYRRTAMIALLAPFVLFTPVILAAALMMDNAWDRVYMMFLFASHIGGCVGDLYDTFLYLFRFKDNSTLMCDAGPMQTFYIKK